jgi:NAD(P)-dependent dehydrogenase (short-subunit alcohol dehydrogenase family)
MSVKPTVLITGASSGIGAVYADRFARRGHDLVLVARDLARMERLAERLRREAGVQIDVLQADLTDEQDLERVEQRLRDDVSIGVLVNNAGAVAHGDFLAQSGTDLTKIIALNVTALARLANAVGRRRVYRQHWIGCRARPGNRAHRLWRDQGFRSLPDPRPEHRARFQRRLLAGCASRRHAHRDLGSFRP